MFEGHDPYLVGLSVLIAILGGYTGFGLAARIRGTPGLHRRLLLAGAAVFLAVGIWTMHFVAMLAAPIPQDAAYLVLPTILSFLICVLVVGISLFLVSIGEPSDMRVVTSAILLGGGIVSMHYVGIHALSGNFHIEHEFGMVALAALIAVGTAYGGLRIFLARQGGMRLALSAIAFGFAVSGMHYTGMYGMHFHAMAETGHGAGGLLASSQALSLAVAVLCFLVAAGFLLSLVPEPRRALQTGETGTDRLSALSGEALGDASQAAEPQRGEISIQRIISAPLRGLGQPPRPAPATRLPIEAADGTHFIDATEIRSIKADAHYTLIRDGSRERMCPWSISEAEAQLDPGFFLRVHRSYIVSIPHVSFMRKEGDGAVIELDGETPHLVPVSRAKIAELKARLGLAKRGAPSLTR
jgi:NO-binding membrane sensor protein with MHYT domain